MHISQPACTVCDFLADNCPGAPAHGQPEDLIHNTSQLPSGTPPEDIWRADGVQTPHDIALTAAPTPHKGNGDRAVAVLIAETRMRGSSLRKYILLPEGGCGSLKPAAEKICKFLARCYACFLSAASVTCCSCISGVAQLGAVQQTS